MSDVIEPGSSELGDDLGPIELQPQHHAGLAASSVAMVYEIGRDLGELSSDKVQDAVHVLQEHRVAVASSGRFRPEEATNVGREVRRILAGEPTGRR